MHNALALKPLPHPMLAVVNLSKAAAAWDRQIALVFYNKSFGGSSREFWIHKLPRHLFYGVAHFLSYPISHLSRNKLDCSGWYCVPVFYFELNPFIFSLPFLLHFLLVSFFCDFPQTGGTALFDSVMVGRRRNMLKTIIVKYSGRWE